MARTDLLQEVHGRFEAVHLVYLMGTRGAGKTSFVDDLEEHLRLVPRRWVARIPPTPGETLSGTLDLVVDALTSFLPGDSESIGRMRRAAAAD